MKTVMAGFLLTCIFLRANAQSGLVSPSDATECSNLFFKALLDKDSKTLEAILADDFTITNFEGQLVEGNFLLEGISQGYLKIETSMLSGARTRDYGNVGVVTGIWSARGSLQNNFFSNDIAYMVVCTRAGGQWKVSAVQLTPTK